MFAAGKLVKFAPLPVGLPVKLPKKVVAVQELAIETLLVTLAIPETATVVPEDGNIVLTFKLLDMI